MLTRLTPARGSPTRNGAWSVTMRVGRVIPRSEVEAHGIHYFVSSLFLSAVKSHLGPLCARPPLPVSGRGRRHDPSLDCSLPQAAPFGGGRSRRGLSQRAPGNGSLYPAGFSQNLLAGTVP